MGKGFRPALFLFAAVMLSGSAVRAEEVFVAAAHSMKEVVDELSAGYEKSHPGVKIVRNYGASGALAKQVEAGAPAYIFLSASVDWVERLKKLRLVEADSVTVIASNALVFVGREGVKAAGMNDLPALSRIAIGSPKSVPAGEYASQAMASAKIAKKMAKKLVLARDVREALLYAERGEVDGAFVYRTDAKRSKSVKVLFEVPQELYDKVAYPVALTAAGAKKPAARAFFDLFRSAAPKPVLKRMGFTLP